MECASACNAQEFVKCKVVPGRAVCEQVGAREDVITMRVTRLTTGALSDAIKDGEGQAKAELQCGDKVFWGGCICG